MCFFSKDLGLMVMVTYYHFCDPCLFIKPPGYSSGRPGLMMPLGLLLSYHSSELYLCFFFIITFIKMNVFFDTSVQLKCWPVQFNPLNDHGLLVGPTFYYTLLYRKNFSVKQNPALRCNNSKGFQMTACFHILYYSA